MHLVFAEGAFVLADPAVLDWTLAHAVHALQLDGHELGQLVEVLVNFFEQLRVFLSFFQGVSLQFLELFGVLLEQGT